jgi:hypothetical protein
MADGGGRHDGHFALRNADGRSGAAADVVEDNRSA